jgi:hypothetical protein
VCVFTRFIIYGSHQFAGETKIGGFEVKRWNPLRDPCGARQAVLLISQGFNAFTNNRAAASVVIGRAVGASNFGLYSRKKRAQRPSVSR